MLGAGIARIPTASLRLLPSSKDDQSMPEPRNGKSKFAYGWVTLILFLLSLTGHWVFAWFAYIDEQQVHGQSPQFIGYVIQTMRDTLENWQSEFLQLIWQVAGLAYLWYVGSPQSKEGEDRLEAKLDLVLKKLDPERYEATVIELERLYPKK
jgi:hypothetical protein